MLRRWRRMEISLAAKCQILFGTAIAAIIFAALFVPWQRMEQLTEQLNEKAAGAVAQTLLNDHVLRETLGRRDVELPARSPLSAERSTHPPPKLVGVARVDDPSAHLTRFELFALHSFASDPQARVEKRYYDNGEGYRYAVALTATAECADCHRPTATSATLPANPLGAVVAPLFVPPPSASPSRPTTNLAEVPPLIGMVSVDLPTQIKTREVLLNRLFILLAGLIAGSMAIIIFYLITTRLILQPVRVLQETAEKVSQGDLNIRSDINTGDEFQQLSETFNTMLINLKRSADQLRAVNKSLDLKLDQLAQSNLALFESNRLKSEFLANVSHELRTPLNSILGFAELLKEQVQSNTDARSPRYLQNILNSGGHLLDLINDLLDLAKIEAGKMEVRSEPLSLPDLFEGLISLLKPLSEGRQLTIHHTIGPDVPILQTDPAKLQQILYNLLSNAIKFSPVGGKIELFAERIADDEAVRLSVIDQGPGIPVEKQSLIFEKFRQLDASHTREHSGTGLGLAISKELAALLSGTIGVRSTPGEGSTFWLIVPLAIEAGSQDVRGRMVVG